MLPELERLIRLQDIETRAAASRKRIADAPGEIAALDARLTASQEAVASAKQGVTDNQNRRRTLDKDLITAQQRLSKYKEQLMDVKTNTEYHAMQHQIASANAEVANAEEQILVNMLEADELSSRLKSTEGALKSDESSVAKERRAIQEDAAQKQATLDQSNQDRASVVADLDRNALDMFERVLKARQGIAVAQAINGTCTVCHVRLRPQVYNTILRNDAIVQCDHCQRILYFAGVHQRSAAGQAALDAAQTRQDEHERP